MAIYFDWYENPKLSKEEETYLHARPFLNGKVTTSEICEQIQQRCSLTKADVVAVLESLSDVMGTALADGKQVHLEGLGFFSPSLKLKGKVNPDMPAREQNSMVEFKGINFTMDKKLRNSIGTVEVKLSRFTSASLPIDDQKIENLLKDYFAENEFLTRKKFQAISGLSQTTAGIRLRKMREAGFIENIGTRLQPIYKPTPGHFGCTK